MNGGYVRVFPESTDNPNVPAGVFLVGEIHSMWGWTWTWYITKRGGRYGVADAANSKPWPEGKENISRRFYSPRYGWIMRWYEVEEAYQEWLNKQE